MAEDAKDAAFFTQAVSVEIDEIAGFRRKGFAELVRTRGRAIGVDHRKSSS
jgi:hypothetical protein